MKIEQLSRAAYRRKPAKWNRYIERIIESCDSQATLDGVLRAWQEGKCDFIHVHGNGLMILTGERPYLHIWGFAGRGERADAAKIMRYVIKYARDVGAAGVILRGRKGWRRILEPYGFEPMGDDLVRVI